MSKIEMQALVMQKVHADKVSDQDLFALYSAFNRMLKFMRSPKNELVIYSYNDLYQQRLISLLPFMPNFELRRVVVKKQTWQEIKLMEALGRAVT